MFMLLIKDVLRLLNCDVLKLEEQIFLTIIGDATTVSGAIIYTSAEQIGEIALHKIFVI